MSCGQASVAKRTSSIKPHDRMGILSMPVINILASAWALRLTPDAVHSLDTGRLNPETYRLFDAVEKHYNIHIEYTFPDAQEVTDLVRAKGMFSFYEDGHQECCRVRKVSSAPISNWHMGHRSQGLVCNAHPPASRHFPGVLKSKPMVHR